MFSIINISKNVHFNTLLVQQIRYKSKTHWAKLKKKTSPKYKAQNHFDEFYGSVFGKKWPPMKEAMLRRSKYVAVVNNYGDSEETIEFLTERGAHCLTALMSVQQEFHKQYPPTSQQADIHTDTNTARLEQYTAKVQSDDISSIYPQDNMPEKLELSELTIRSSEVEKEVEKQIPKSMTLEESLASAQMDMSRIIDASMGVTSEALYQYVPASQLKGMDEWVPESLHYSYYARDNKDFPLVIEPETEFSFPEHLKVYTYEMGSEWNMFPEPKRCKTIHGTMVFRTRNNGLRVGSEPEPTRRGPFDNLMKCKGYTKADAAPTRVMGRTQRQHPPWCVFNYYPMDCGSVLAVLALCLSPGDRVLDLCSAPGGKALVALQTLLPDVIVCNDSSISRTNRITRVFRDYLIDFETSNSWRERVVLSTRDGRDFTDDLGFDKVLVDAPCTTDRRTINQDANLVYRLDRVKDRLSLPDVQPFLLANALKLVRVGGAVVYSTCSLSPVQNDGVVHMALKHAFETHGVVATVKDLSAPWASLAGTLRLGAGPAAPRYGQLVAPSADANFGPSYIARLVRVK